MGREKINGTNYQLQKSAMTSKTKEYQRACTLAFYVVLWPTMCFGGNSHI